MEPKFQTSFIPRQSLESSAGMRRGGGRRVGILTVIAVTLFLASLLTAGGAFFYERFLEQSIAGKGAELERLSSEFDPKLIDELTRLDARLSVSAELIKNHVALSELFRLLETYTLQNVRFESFDFKEGSRPGSLALSMKGRAKSYASVALQSDVFAEIPFLKEQLFENPNLDPQGNVTFDYSAEVDPSLLSYVEALGEGGTSETP